MKSFKKQSKNATKAALHNAIQQECSEFINHAEISEQCDTSCNKNTTTFYYNILRIFFGETIDFRDVAKAYTLNTEHHFENFEFIVTPGDLAHYLLYFSAIENNITKFLFMADVLEIENERALLRITIYCGAFDIAQILIDRSSLDFWNELKTYFSEHDIISTQFLRNFLALAGYLVKPLPREWWNTVGKKKLTSEKRTKIIDFWKIGFQNFLSDSRNEFLPAKITTIIADYCYDYEKYVYATPLEHIKTQTQELPLFLKNAFISLYPWDNGVPLNVQAIISFCKNDDLESFYAFTEDFVVPRYFCEYCWGETLSFRDTGRIRSSLLEIALFFSPRGKIANIIASDEYPFWNFFEEHLRLQNSEFLQRGQTHEEFMLNLMNIAGHANLDPCGRVKKWKKERADFARYLSAWKKGFESLLELIIGCYVPRDISGVIFNLSYDLENYTHLEDLDWWD